jgi:hypothetical protein
MAKTPYEARMEAEEKYNEAMNRLRQVAEAQRVQNSKNYTMGMRDLQRQERQEDTTWWDDALLGTGLGAMIGGGPMGALIGGGLGAIKGIAGAAATRQRGGQGFWESIGKSIGDVGGNARGLTTAQVQQGLLPIAMMQMKQKAASNPYAGTSLDRNASGYGTAGTGPLGSSSSINSGVPAYSSPGASTPESSFSPVSSPGNSANPMDMYEPMAMYSIYDQEPWRFT